MIEKQVPGIKFDLDRKELKANVIHNEVTNRQNKTDVTQKTLHIFTKSNMQ